MNGAMDCLSQIAAEKKDVLEKLLGCAVSIREDGVLECNIESENITNALLTMRDNPEIKAKILTDVFAVDYPNKKQRFQVIYMLLSLTYNVRVCCKVDLDEGNSVVPSATGVFASAGWFEREVFDMYGIKFQSHPDLRRILTDYEFTGHPMLKDFPLSGYTEVRYDIEKGKVTYQPVNLQQDFRTFSSMSPWKGENGS